MDEYDPTEELGLPEDRQFITSCDGPVTVNDGIRNLCARYMDNGGRVFDVLSKYSDVRINPSKTSRGDSTRELMSTLIPLLKVSGITDHGAHAFFEKDIKILPGADTAMRHIWRTMPSYINTGMYEHHMMCVSERIGFPMADVNCSEVPFDLIDIKRTEANKIRRMISRISKMDARTIPDGHIEPGSYVSREGWDAVQELDSMFLDKIPDMEFNDVLPPVMPVGPGDKPYALLEIRKQSSIDLDLTFYAGSGPTDFEVLDIVRDGGGVAVSFNGCERTVLSADIAVMSSDAIVLAALAAEFYSEGPEAVYELAENWNRGHLEKKISADKNITRGLLKKFPKKLPEVIALNDGNVYDAAKRSEAYRRKLRESSRNITAMF